MIARELLRGAGLAFALRVAGAGLGLVLNWWLAHHLGPSGLGLFFLAMTVVSIAALAGRLGLENAVLRFISTAVAGQDWDKVRQVSRDSMILATGASILVTAALVLLAPWASTALFHKPQLIQPLRWLAFAIILMAAIVLYGEMLKAVQRIRDAQIVQSVMTPALALGIFAALGTLNLKTVVLTYSLAMLATALAGWLLWRRSCPQLHGLRPAHDYRGLLTTSTSFIWVQAMYTLTDWADILILGMVGSSEQVGIYGLAKRIAMAISFVLIAVNNVVSPRFAAFHHNGDRESLRRVAIHASRMTALTAGPFLITLLLVPGWIMNLFGHGFQTGGIVLGILVAAQFVNIATGSVGQILAMTGHEKTLRNIAVSSTVLNIALLVVLTPLFGMIGAALSTGLAIIIDNLLKSYFVVKYHGFRVDIIAASLPGKRQPLTQ